MNKIKHAIAVTLLPLVLGTGCKSIVKTGLGIGAPGLSEIERDFAATAVAKDQDAALDLLKDPKYKEQMNKNFQDRINKVTPEQWANLLDTAGLPPAFSATAKTMLTNIVSKSEQGKKDAEMLTQMAAMSPLAQQQSSSVATSLPSQAASVSGTAQLVTSSGIPLYTNATTDFKKAATNLNILYVNQGRIFESNVASDVAKDVTSQFAPNMSDIQHVRKFPTADGIFFMQNNNLYHSSVANNQAKISLIAENIHMRGYQAHGNTVYFTTASDKKSSIKKVSIDGARLEEVVGSYDASFSDLKVSPNGMKALVKRIPKHPNHISQPEVIVIDLTKKHNYFKVPFEHMPQHINWNEDTGVVFVQKGELHTAALGGFSSDCACYPLSNETQLTYDEAHIDSAQGTPQGILFRSSKSGSSDLYLHTKEGAAVKLSSFFRGFDVQIAGTAPVVSLSQQTDVYKMYLDNPQGDSLIKGFIRNDKLRPELEAILSSNGVDFQSYLQNPASIPQATMLLSNQKVRSNLSKVLEQNTVAAIKPYKENPMLLLQ